MKRLFATVSIAILIWACAACSRSSSPTSPTTVPTPTRPTSSPSGLVFAVTPAGLAPVGGARVRLEVGSFRADATTDAQGLYAMTGLQVTGVNNGIDTLVAGKEGYQDSVRLILP